VTAKSVGQWNREQSCSPAFFKQCAKQCAQQDADRATTCHELLAQLTGTGSDLSPRPITSSDMGYSRVGRPTR